MTYFVVGPDTPALDACAVCCCLEASARPAETSKWRLNYAPWVAEIGGRGLVSLPSFELKELTPCPAGAGNLPPTNTDKSFTMERNATLLQSLATGANDPNGDTLHYALVPLYGPMHGSVTIALNGDMSYTPALGYVGYDAFFFTTSDGINPPVMNRAAITVNAPAPVAVLPAPPPHNIISIAPERIGVKSPLVEFPLVVSPAAKPGSIWRLTVLQTAMDCDGGCYSRQTCFDIRINRC